MRAGKQRQAMLILAVALVAAGAVLAMVLSVAPFRQMPAAGPIMAIGPATPPPQPPPAIFENTPPDAARASNAQVPIVTSGLVTAPKFRFTGTIADRAAAEACLTAAVLYEAGDDPPGEKAVAQVVLNRVRHPAFPKTVCGVILQGSERHTGCQFTFTCDGALARTPSAQGWARVVVVTVVRVTVDVAPARRDGRGHRSRSSR